MISDLSFKNFRGIKEMVLSDLRQVTLISGKNNSGKSSILEGIFLLFDHISPDSFIKLNSYRGMGNASDSKFLFNPLFYSLDVKKTIEISMKNDGVDVFLEYIGDDSYVPYDIKGLNPNIISQYSSSSKTANSIKFRFSYGDYMENGHFFTSSSGIYRSITTNNDNQIKPLPIVKYVNSSIVNNDAMIAEWFGKIELEGKKQQVIDILKTIEGSLTDVSAIAVQGQIQLYAKMGNKLLPLKLAGDGVNRLLYIVLAVISNPDSVLLIDEIETGFHYSMYPKLWEVIATAAKKNNCQIIASTHSYECIDGAVDGIESAFMNDDFCYYRIEREEKEDRVYRYSSDLVKSAIDFSLEVR